MISERKKIEELFREPIKNKDFIDLVSQRKISREVLRRIKGDFDFTVDMEFKMGSTIYNFLCSTATTYERVYAYHQGVPMTGFLFKDGTRRYSLFVKGKHYEGVAPIREFYDLYNKGRNKDFEVLSCQVFDLTATRKGYLEFLEIGLASGKMSELFAAICLYKDFTLKGYMSSSYECQVFLDYLTDSRYKQPAGSYSREHYLSQTNLMLTRCKVEGKLVLYKNKYVRHTFTYNGNSFLKEDISRLTTKDNESSLGKSLPLVCAPKKVQDLLNKELGALFTTWSETKDNSNTFYLKVISKSFSREVDLSFFKEADSSIEIVKPCVCNFVVACIEESTETKVISESSVKFKSLSFSYNMNTKSLILESSSFITKDEISNFKLNNTLKDFKVVSMSENGGVICRSYNQKPSIVSWSYSPGFLRKVKVIINNPAVRNKLGKFYSEAFDLLIKDRVAFESKYLSNEVDIYNFYYGLLDCYSSLATTSSGMFKVRDLRETNEDFSEDTIREAFKIVNSKEDLYKKEIKDLRESAKGTNVKI